MTEDTDLEKQLKDIKNTLMADNQFAAAKEKLANLGKQHPGHEKTHPAACGLYLQGQ